MNNPLLDLIVQGESGAAGYNAYNRGTYVDANGGKHIRGPNGAIDFSSLTVGQVHDRQHLRSDDANRVFAVGKYQVIPATMDDAIIKLNLDRNQPFTPTLQDRIFSEYLIVDKRPDIHGYITDQPGVTLKAAQRSLAAEWAGFGDPDRGGASHYGGANHASITLAQSESALKQMRASYQADLARGLSPTEAWKDVTASDHARPASESLSEPSSSHLQQQGDHDAAVRTLQGNLIALGYHDSHGHLLKADGDFGPHTHFAVEAFQHDHHLVVDGKVGPQTRHALAHAIQSKAPPAATLLNDARHPDHALYEQARAGVRKIDAEIGHQSDGHSDNLAAALTVEARRQDLTRIDQVALSESGERAFALQSGAFTQMAHVKTSDAVNVSIARSSAAWAQAVQQAAACVPTQEVQFPRRAPQSMGR
ncbi:MAG TPA: peptidoglycan-binding domain-containing protein [Rhodanobacter sp.]|nr:peptidoglycan-binding domain-containing protein [Rhodanobacter sp.]